MSDGASVVPKIAVVVGAFGRREFLERAVASVVGQTIPRTEFEVIVTKNFADPALDDRLAARGVRTLLDPEPVIGRWLARAVAATRAPLVAFLDDDDEFAPERLAQVLAVFAQHPTTGYYRNRVTVIDADGRSVPVDKWRRLELDAAFDRTGPVVVPAGARADGARLVSREAHVSFNSSTVVVRREILAGAAGNVFAATELPDLALLVSALIAPYDLYLDDQRLTRFRSHGAHATQSPRWPAIAARSQAALAEFAEGAGRTDLATPLRALSRHYARVYESSRVLRAVREGRPSREVAGLAAGYLRWLGRHPTERGPNPEVWTPLVYALGALLLPPVGRGIALARRPKPR